jgi:hypothetical protein
VAPQIALSLALLLAAAPDARPAAGFEARQALVCRTILPLADIARASDRQILYRRVLAHYERAWEAWAAAQPDAARALEASTDLAALRAGSRQTKNTQAAECLKASGISANEQIVE